MKWIFFFLCLLSTRALVSGQSQEPCSDLFISEIVYKPVSLNLNEANEAIELFNPTQSDIDLTDYVVLLALDDYSTKSYRLEGVIEHHQTFVICSKDSDGAVDGLANLVIPNFTFEQVSNISLFHADKLIDLFGHPGPSTPLSLIDINSIKDTAYMNTLRIGIGSFPGINIFRNELVKYGQTSEFKSVDVFNSWALKTTNYVSLGDHLCTCSDVVLGWYGTNQYDITEHFYEVEYPETHWLAPQLTEPLPADFEYAIELIPSYVYNSLPINLSMYPKANNNDLIYEPIWTFPFGNTTQQIDAIKHIICENPPVIEGDEIFGFELDITNSNNMPVHVSAAWGYVFFLIHDCLNTPTTEIVDDIDIKVLPTILVNNPWVQVSTNNNIIVKKVTIFNLNTPAIHIDSNQFYNDGMRINLSSLLPGEIFIMFETDAKTVIKKVLKI